MVWTSQKLFCTEAARPVGIPRALGSESSLPPVLTPPPPCRHSLLFGQPHWRVSLLFVLPESRPLCHPVRAVSRDLSHSTAGCVLGSESPRSSNRKCQVPDATATTVTAVIITITSLSFFGILAQERCACACTKETEQREPAWIPGATNAKNFGRLLAALL